MKRTVATFSATLALASCLVACSSSGGSGVSESKLESKLKSEPQLKSALQQTGAKATVVNKMMHCIAVALEKDANKSDLKKYVDGKLDLADIGGSSKGSASKAQADAKTCTENAVKSGG